MDHLCLLIVVARKLHMEDPPGRALDVGGGVWLDVFLAEPGSIAHDSQVDD